MLGNGLYLTLILLLICLPINASAEDKITVASTQKTPSTILILLAQKEGMFKKYGLEVNLLETAQRAQAVISGSAQFALGSTTDLVIMYANKGSDLKQVAIMADNIPIKLYASPGVKSLADLKGKTVAVLQSGSSTLILSKMLLKSAGVNPNDVNFIFAPSYPAIATMLMSGAVDAGTLEAVTSYPAEKQGLRSIANLMDISYPVYGVAARESYLSKNRNITERFLKALAETVTLLKNNEQKTKSVIENDGHYNNPERVELLYAHYKNYFPPYIMRPPTLSDMEKIRDVLAQINPQIVNLDLKTAYDNTSVHDLKLFLEDLRKKIKN